MSIRQRESVKTGRVRRKNPRRIKSKYNSGVWVIECLYRDDKGDEMWNFGSGSYNTDKAKQALYLTGKKKTKKAKKEKILQHKIDLNEATKPSNIEDDLDDFGLDEDEL